MHQFGYRTAVAPAATVAVALAAPALDQDAWGTVIQGGYTWTEHSWQPRLGVLYSYASGDKNSADGSSETFQNLFATTHLHYGYMDLNSLQNLHDVRFVLSAKPRANISLAAEVHFQQLARTTDFWYNVAGVPRNFTGAAVGSGGGLSHQPHLQPLARSRGRLDRRVDVQALRPDRGRRGSLLSRRLHQAIPSPASAPRMPTTFTFSSR